MYNSIACGNCTERFPTHFMQFVHSLARSNLVADEGWLRTEFQTCTAWFPPKYFYDGLSSVRFSKGGGKILRTKINVAGVPILSQKNGSIFLL